MNLQLPVYILAGGKSSRFGNPNDDKALAEIDKTPLILLLARQLRPIANPLLIVAERAGKYQNLNLNTIADHNPGLGPLAGLQRALSHHHNSILNNSANPASPLQNWLLLLSCDLITIKHNWVRILINETQPDTPPPPTNPSHSPPHSPRHSPRIIAFADFDRHQQATRIHPMPALYHQSISQTVNQHLQAHDLSMRSLIRAVPFRPLPLPEDWPELPQINTTDEYHRITGKLPENKEI